MKKILLVAAVLAAHTLAAADTYLYPTYPGTSTRDYSRPGYVIEEDPLGDVMPSFLQQDRVMYPTLPGTSTRDYSRPGYVIEEPPQWWME